MAAPQKPGAQPLQFHPVAIPLVGGIGVEVDKRMRPPERLEVARNVRCTELGGLAKRYGFTALNKAIIGQTANLDKNGTPRALAATQTELLCIGARDLYAYVPAWGQWFERGHLAPGGVRTTPMFREHAKTTVADMGVSGSYELYAAQRAEVDRDNVKSSVAIELRGKTIAGDVTFGPVKVESANPNGNDYVFRPLVAANGADLVCMFGKGQTGSAADLKLYAYDTNAPHSQPAAETDITADLFHDTVRSGHYDVIAFGTSYVTAYVNDSARDIVLQRWNTAHAQQATATIAGTFSAVAMSDTVAGSSNFYVLTIDNASGDPANNNVLLYQIRGSDLTVVWGPITIDAPAASEIVSQLGVTEGLATIAGIDELRVACSFRMARSGGAGAAHRQCRSRSTNTSGADLDDLHITHNAGPQSRPFFYGNRCLQHLMTDYTEDQSVPAAAWGYQTHMLADLHIGETVRLSRMAAMFGVGQAPGVGGAGCQNHVVLSTTDTEQGTSIYRHMHTIQGRGTTLGQGQQIWNDVAEHHMGEVPLMQPMANGCAVIGGGYVGWYDGYTTRELGFASPPWIDLVETAGSGSAPPAATYTYVNHWEDYDNSGTLHRSLQSLGINITTGSAHNIRLDARALPCTRRLSGGMSVMWFRASSLIDGVYRQVTRIGEMTHNSVLEKCDRLIDNVADASVTVPIYTTGGVIEAVAPNGSRIPFVTRERLWLGGQYHPSAVSFSGLIVPETASSTIIAPSVFEAFVRITERGEMVTGISSLDTATVICTATTIYLVSGYGPDARGQKDDMSRLTSIPTADGCTEPRSVLSYTGGVIWKSKRGLTLLSRDQGLDPLFGEPVRDLLDTYPVVGSAVAVPEERQLRLTIHNAAKTAGRVIVFDYRIKQWFEWDIRKEVDTLIVPVSATYVDDTYYLLAADGSVYFENSATHYDDSAYYPPTIIETGEIQPAGNAQWMATSEVILTLEKADAHGVKMYVAHDYEDTPAAAECTWTETIVDSLRDPTNREQLSRKLATPRSRSIRIRIEDTEGAAATTGAGFVAHEITVLAAIAPGGPRVESQARM